MPELTEVQVLERAEELLSSAQRQAVLGRGDRLITACPGAGKTRSISARAALLVSRGDLIALTTYTNVGARAMAASLERDFGTGLDDQHFVGTLHGLLLRYVFHPFGHLVMNCATSPSVRVGPTADHIEVNGWSLDPDDFKFESDGRLSFHGSSPQKYVKKTEVAATAQELALASKRAQAQEGVVTADDAMFWSLRALMADAEARQAISARFSEIIIDEAQDTSALQVACLEQLMDPDQRPSLFLVGDFDQSIYAFQGASPQACLRLAEKADLEQVRLAENYRSSQLICNVSALLRHLRVPDRAMGPNAALELQPTVILYSRTEVDRVPEQFARVLTERGLRPATSAVIARGNGLVGQISGAKSRKLRGTSRLLGLLLELTARRHTALTRTQVTWVEDLLTEVALPALGSSGAHPAGEGVRDATMSIIEALPEGDITLGEWRAGAVSALNSTLLSLNPETAAIADHLLALPVALAAEPLADFLPASRQDGLLVATVHGVKGMSLDAVLLVADYELAWYGREPERWGEFFQASLEGRSVHLDTEELRILYVGVTRAERLLCLALPNDTDRAALSTFVAAGFCLEEDST